MDSCSWGNSDDCTFHYILMDNLSSAQVSTNKYAMSDVMSEKIVDEITKDAGEELLNRIVQCLVDNGKLMVIGLGGHGKTSASMTLVQHLMKTENFIIKIADSANVWKWTFDKIPFVDVTKRQSIPEDEKTLLLDLGFTENKMNISLVENLVRGDYYLQRELMNKNEGQVTVKRIYVIEEIQNVLGSYSLSGNSGEFWLKWTSEGRNYGQYLIGIGQRLGDISAKIVERTRYFLLGAISGENDSRKLRSMFISEKGKRVVDVMLGLKKGEFLFLDKENTENSFKIYFPKFVQNGKPYEYGAKNNGKLRIERVFF